jgi:hypothetical protein
MAVRRRSMVPLLLPLLAFGLASLLAGRVAPAEAPPAAIAKPAGLAAGFLRLAEDGAAGGRLETADVTYKRPDGTSVCLISAIHIGERAYFEGLNASFRKYDAVLFELVKPKDGLLPGAPGAAEPQGAGGNPIRDFQRLMNDTLNLSFQLDVIDYGAKNFVHADLDAETFEKLQRDKGQTFPELFMKAMIRAMNDPEAGGGKNLPLAGADDPDAMIKSLIRTFTRPDSERQLKLMIARQMTGADAEAAFLGGDDSVIVHDRNAAAVKVLEQTLKDPAKKQIAIFYGAAHMPDLEKRLTTMGFTQAATEWRTAWDLKIRADQPSAIEKLLEDAVDELLKGVEEPAREPGPGEPVVRR